MNSTLLLVKGPWFEWLLVCKRKWCWKVLFCHGRWRKYRANGELDPLTYMLV